jgi:photosystem II stability/assembly factor-like uncharacterized protein
MMVVASVRPKVLLLFTCVFSLALWAATDEWTGLPVSEGGYLGRVFSDPADPNTIYTSNGDPANRGILKSTDGGASWHGVIISSPPTPLSALVIDPQNPGAMFAGTFGPGVFKSTDGGESWENTGLATAYISALAIDPQNGSNVYAFARAIGNSPDWGMYKSTDAGKTWTNLGPPSSLAWSVITLAIHPKDSSILYAGDGGLSNGGLYKSANGGLTWSLVPEMETCNMVAVAIPRQDPSTQYAGGSCDGDMLIGKVFKSTDSGMTWTDMNSGLPENRSNLWGLVVDPDHPQILYAGFRRIGVFRSVDGGNSWTAFNSGLPNLDVWSLALGRGMPNVVYANTGAGLFKINDTSLIVTNASVDPISIRGGSSFTATFAGTNLTDETYFDVRFRSPGSAEEQVAQNWQRGKSSSHIVPIGTVTGAWTITGVSAHQNPNDQNSDFAPVSATLTVIP